MQSFLGADKVYYGRCANGEWRATWLRYDTLFNVVTKCRVVMFLFLFPEVVGKYRNKIQGLDIDLKEILKQESEEKEVK